VEWLRDGDDWSMQASHRVANRRRQGCDRSNKFDGNVANISGTVLKDGGFGATIGFRHLTGSFTKDMFEGIFESFGCAWKTILKIKNPQ
jgi:hypothetical protein